MEQKKSADILLKPEMYYDLDTLRHFSGTFPQKYYFRCFYADIV